MNKMDESDLLRFLEAEAAAAYHHVSGDLAAEREKGLRAYMREPYGTEMEGRSQVVSILSGRKMRPAPSRRPTLAIMFSTSRTTAS